MLKHKKSYRKYQQMPGPKQSHSRTFLPTLLAPKTPKTESKKNQRGSGRRSDKTP